jgi:hypothetical protein
MALLAVCSTGSHQPGPMTCNRVLHEIFNPRSFSLSLRKGRVSRQDVEDR